MPRSSFPIPHHQTIHPRTRHTHTIIVLNGSPRSGLHESLSIVYDRGTPSFPLSIHLPTCKFLIFDHLPTCATSTVIEPFTSILTTESQDVGSGKIILLGVNGGCTTAVHALLASVAGRGEVGAMVAVSGWLPFAREVAAGYREASKGGPLSGWSAFSHARARERVKAGNNTGKEFSVSEFYERTLGVDLRDKVGKGAKWGRGKKGVPVLIAQCADRDIVERGLGLQMEKVLGNLGMEVEYKEYTRGGEWLKSGGGIRCVVRFLQRTLRLPTV
ncbi:MAG: hypothetical protein LQ352_003906 [Teloschistes flavicans]|nr:MAG: hypothetical protein LQ352_003906 [Teloschistes flavicans]